MILKSLFAIGLLTLCHWPSTAQEMNGFTNLKPSTHSLIIGISKYANIEDLKFADRDAKVFRNYLLNTLDTRSDSSNIVMLLNKQAVSPAIYQALENLVSMVEEGDKVYIYFSGHGDSENSTIFKSGFLLTHDTPKGNYYTNSINVDILNHFIQTLSSKNKADVMFIADACRSGNVSFSEGNGTVQTVRSLTKSVADEVRLLSCQPEEISLEGSQWGNGRGLFSFHLINGLYGMADNADHGDGMVNLNELNLYLSTHVPKDAAPVSQYPGVYGPMHKVISRINPKVLAELNVAKQSEATALSKSRSKGYEDKFIATLQPEQLKFYKAFNRTMSENKLQRPAGNNALFYYEALAGSDIDETFLMLLKRKLIATLQEEPQRFIHQLSDVNKRWEAKDIKYGKWSKQILLSTELLGEDHYLFKTLMAKHYFFSAADSYYRAREANNINTKKMLASESLTKINAAIDEDPVVPYYHNLKGVTFSLMEHFNSAVYAFDEAIRINPDYPYPYSNKGYALMKLGDYEKALEHFNHCIELDRKYNNAYQYKIAALKKLERDDEAMEVYRELISTGTKIGM